MCTRTILLIIVMILIITNYSIFAQGSGLDFSKAIEITNGQTINGTTQSQTSRASSYSGVNWNETGPEDIYKITISEISRLISTLTNISVNLDVFILDSTSTNKCVAYGDRKATYANSTPKVYYIIVDGRDNAAGSYSLTVQYETGFPKSGNIVWSEDFEDNPDQDWHTDYGVWEMGVPTSGPNSAFVGEKLAATKLDGNYLEWVTTRLIRHKEFKVPEAKDSPTLMFWHWFTFNLGDGGRVQIKKTTDTDWKDLISISWHAGRVWTHTKVDLSEYAGQIVQIAFCLISTDAAEEGGWETDLGWYIDNVVVINYSQKFKNPEPFDSNSIYEWNAPCGSWEIGVPTTGPQMSYSSPFCAATVLDGNYEEWVNSDFISPKLKLPAGSTNLALRFRHWYSFNHGDNGKVFLKTALKKDLILLDTYGGNSAGWGYTYFNLNSYADSTIQIVFRLISIDASAVGGWETDVGWYIDDVEIQGPPPPSDTLSPITYNVKAEPNPTQGDTTITLSALISDVGKGDSRIGQAEYFIDKAGVANAGYAMAAKDGAFNSSNEEVTVTVSVASWEIGSSHKLFVHGKDEYNNWSEFDSVIVQVTRDQITRLVYIPDTTAVSGDTIIIPVKISNATGVAAAEIKVTYDSNILNALSASTTTLTNKFLIDDSVMTGKIAVSMACSTGLSGGNRDFINIEFTVNDSVNAGATSPLHFELVELYDENENPIPVTTQDGSFTVVSDTSGEIVRIFIKPPSDTLNISATREFSAFGKRSDSSEVSVSVNWVLEKKFGNIGNINPGSGKKTTFTAIGPGDGLIKATYNGTLTATAVLVVGKLKGDINIDDKVNVQDAIRCLQIAVGTYGASLYQKWAADYNGDGKFEENDAWGILIESLKGLLPKVIVYKTSGTATVRMGSFIYESDDIVTLPILIDGRDDVFASGFEIHYNSQMLTALAATSSMPSSYMATNFNKSGTAKISLINLHGLLNSQGEIIRLKFKSNGKQDGNPELNIKDVRLFDRQAQRIEIDVNLDQETITAVPKAYELHQNYPNPFNPTTAIQYDLPKESKVSLVIFNVQGQVVKSLVNGSMMPEGSHKVVWDGCDNIGNVVPAGIYFYQLRINEGDWQKTNKMVLVK